MAEIKVRVSVNKNELKELKSELKNGDYTLHVKAKADGVTQTTKETQNLGNQVKTTTNEVNNLGSAFVAKIKWGLIQSSIRGVADAFMYAVENMKEVDTQITNIAKVTNQSVEELGSLADKAYATASKYGVSAGQYMEAVYEYTKAGFKDNADQMAELSTKAMLVGDTTAAIADKFLIAGNAAFGFQGNIQKLSMMVDQADYINNNYATTLDKIAEGFPRVASVANMAGMTAEQTMAALGTITATTQETASRAGTALRALVMNILKDTTTEIEEGVTATEESINGLRDALEQYAPEVVAAADATGQLINPMEALKALADAYNDGLLTDRAMTEIEMALGGKLRTNQLDALLKNFSMYEEMLTGMGQAAGTADTEVGIMLESWESKTEILKNTWTEFVSKSLDSSVFKGAIDGLTQIIRLFGDFNHLLATAAGAIAFVKIAKSVKGLTTQMTSLENTMGAIKIKMADMIVTGKAADASGNMTKPYKALQQQLKSLQTEYDKTATKAQTLSRIGLGIGIATTAFSVITMIINAVQQARQEYLDGLAEIRDEAIQQANSSAEEANSLYDLYVQYENIKQAYENNAATKEAYQTATEQLASALGVEQETVDKLAASYQYLTEVQLKSRIADLEAAALKAKEYFIEANSGKALFGEGVTSTFDPDSVNPAYGAAAWEEANKFYVEGHDDAWLEQVYRRTKAYQTVLDMYEKEAKGSVDYINKIGEARKKAIEDAKKWFSDLSESGLQEFIDSEDALREMQEKLAAVQNGEIVNEEASEQVEETTSAIHEQAEAYETLAESVDHAKGALEAYNEATKEQKGDTYKEYVNAYEKFLTDWENGLKGSTNVQAALDLFFTNEQISAMRKKGIDVGETLASDFYQSLFTHMEEEGREFNKEDFGAYAAFALYDDQEGQYLAEGYERVADQIIDKHGEVVAEFSKSIDENGEESIEIMVNSFEALGEALNIDPRFLAVWFDALGVHYSGIEENAEGLTKLAESLGALEQNAAAVNEEGIIDVSKMIQGLGEAGEQANSIWNTVERLKELQASGELQLDIDLNSEEGMEKVAALINEFAAADEAEIEPETEIDTEAATSEYNTFIEESNNKKITPTVEPQLSAAELAMQNFLSKPRVINVQVKETKEKAASGTKNAKGGLTLVNEEGPEIIAEDGTARIAGNGLPALTILQKGATVFNAADTRKIFENSGIDALAGGTAKGIKRPQAATSNDSGNNSTPSGGGYTAPAPTPTPTETAPAPTGIDEDALANLEYAVKLHKSWLEVSESLNESAEEQAKMMQGVADALLEQIKYLETNKGDAVEINNLYAEYYNTLTKIDELQSDAQEEANKKQLKDAESKVDLLKSELSLMEERGRSNSKLADKNREIVDALNEEITLMWRQGASQEELNELLTEREQVKKRIKELDKQDAIDAAEAQANEVARLKSQLEVYEAKDVSYTKLIAKQKEIYDALGKEIELQKKAGASQEEINKLKVDQANTQKAINQLEEEQRQKAQQAKEETAEASSKEVSLLKSQLDILKASGASRTEQIAKHQEIIAALNKEILTRKAAGATEEEINRLILDQYNEREAIKQLQDEEKEERDAEIEKRKQERIDAADEQASEVALLKSQLELLEAQDASVNKRVKKQEQIYDALTEEIRLRKEAGATEEEINKLLTERQNVRNNINKLQEEAKEKAKEEAEQLKEDTLKAQEEQVALLKSQLSLMQAKGASIKRQIDKQKEIQKALLAEIRILKQNGASQEEINKVRQEYYNINKNIQKQEKELFDTLSTAVKDRIDQINKKRDAELKKLKEAKDITEKQNQLEEKKLALEEAREKLANAKAQRTVRVYNAAKGEWQWVANAQDVASARDEVKSAKEALDKYNKDREYDRKVEEINAKYDARVEQWQKIIDTLTEPAVSLGNALGRIEKNATKAMKSTIRALNKILKPLGHGINPTYDSGGVLHGIGGIKATSSDEMVLPPDLTRAMLTPISGNMFSQRMNELRYLYGATTGMNGNISTTVGKQINGGNFYQYGNITLTEESARTTTVYEFAQMARNLRSYVATAK